MPRRKRKQAKKSFFIPLLLSALLLLVFFFLFFVPGRFWDGRSRTVLAIAADEGVTLAIFDPVTDSITTLVFPLNVEVEVARNLGTWKLGSVWQLGLNEKVGGGLLSATLMKSFKLPIEAWGQEPALGFTQSSLPALFKSVFWAYKTNLSVKDRLGLTFFALGVKPSGRVTLKAEEVGMLERAILPDGEKGFAVKNTLPAKITALFSDAAVSEEGQKVAIEYASGGYQAEEVGKIIQALGAKVISVVPRETGRTGCLVVGPKTSTRDKIARLFGCQTEENPEILKIILGKNFTL